MKREASSCSLSDSDISGKVDGHLVPIKTGSVWRNGTETENVLFDLTAVISWLAGGALLPRLLLTAGITALVVFKSLMNKYILSKEQRTSGNRVTKKIFWSAEKIKFKNKNTNPSVVHPDPVGSETFGLVECGIIVPNPDPDPNMTFSTKKSLNILLIFLQNGRIHLWLHSYPSSLETL
jgi:hypothetical protein